MGEAGGRLVGGNWGWLRSVDSKILGISQAANPHIVPWGLRNLSKPPITAAYTSTHSCPEPPKTVLNRSWTTQLPVACPDVFAATAIDSNSQAAYFSYYLAPSETSDARDKQRTMAAPGAGIKSTWPRELGMDYKTLSGTSMAWCAG